MKTHQILTSAFLLACASLQAANAASLNQQDKAAPGQGTRNAVDGFEGQLVITSDQDWDAKWASPHSGLPPFTPARTIRLDEQITVLVFFSNPSPDARGEMNVGCDLRVIDGSGVVSADVNDLDCGAGAVGTDHAKIQLATQILRMIARENDAPGVWTVDVNVHDRNANVRVPLKASFTLERIHDVRRRGEPPVTLDRPPEERAQIDVASSNWTDLDGLATELAAMRKLDVDGVPDLRNMTRGITAWLEALPSAQDVAMLKKIRESQADARDSRMAPIVEAMQLHAMAWRARGHGPSSSVQGEGWALFEKHCADAWNALQETRQRSMTLPTWYEQALAIGADAGVSSQELKALLQEGVRRFPNYFPLYAIALREQSQRWGGDYRNADRFIREAADAPSNALGDELYARLKLELDQYDGFDPEFFKKSWASWPRMKSGGAFLLASARWNSATLVRRRFPGTLAPPRHGQNRAN